MRWVRSELRGQIRDDRLDQLLGQREDRSGSRLLTQRSDQSGWVRGQGFNQSGQLKGQNRGDRLDEKSMVTGLLRTAITSFLVGEQTMVTVILGSGMRHQV